MKRQKNCVEAKRGSELLKEQHGLSQGSRRGWLEARTAARLQRTYESRPRGVFIWWEHPTASEVGVKCASGEFLIAGKTNMVGGRD